MEDRINHAQSEPVTEPEQPKNTVPAEQAETREDFQTLIRGKYRADYLQALQKALLAQARQADRYMAYRELCFAAERVRQDHPEFDLMKQIEDPTFARLIENGVDVATAYAVIRREDEDRRDAAIARNAGRPAENGLGGGAGALLRADPRSLSPEERKALRRRAARGEQIVW